MTQDNPDPTSQDLWQAVQSLQERVTQLEAAVHPQQVRAVAKPVEPQHVVAEQPPLPADASRLLASASAAKLPTALDESEAAVLQALVDAAHVEPTSQEIKAVPRADKPAGLSWEQQLGTRWMLILGVGVFILGIVFFFKYMADMGWVNEGVRLLMGTVAGLGLVAFGEYSLRRSLRLFAAGVSAAGIIVLYIVIFVASPNGMGGNYQKFTSISAFGLMCGVTILGVGVALRNGLMLSAMLSLIGALATPVLLSAHKNQEVGLMTYLLAVDAGFLILAMARRWQALAPVALGGTAVLFAGWFASFGAVSPWGLTSVFGWSLWALFMLHAVAASRTQRARPAMTCVLAAVGSALLAVLWLSLPLPRGWLLGQLLVLDVVLLAVGLIQRWWPLAMVAMAASFVVYSRPAGEDQQSLYMLTSCMAWATAALFIAASLAGARLNRFTRGQCIALVALAGSALSVLWLAQQQYMGLSMSLPAAGATSQLLVLDVIVLAVCLAQRWHALRAGALAWTIISLSVTYLQATSFSHIVWCAWIWGFYALFMADIFLRAWWRAIGSSQRLDAFLAAGASAAMFVSTYLLLREEYHEWMGFYAAALGVAYLAATWVVRHKAQRPVMAYTMLGSGLALFTVAIPIQFELGTITFAWSIQAVVLMLLSRRLRSVMLFANSMMAIVLAMVHLYAAALPMDARLATVLLAPFGVDLTQGLALAVCVSAAALAVAGLLRWGQAIRNDHDESAVSTALVVAAGLIFGLQTVRQLPVDAATWWWLGFIAVIGGVAVWRRSRMLSACLLGALLAAAAKWVFCDTLGVRIMSGPSELNTVLNWRLAAGVALAAALLAYVRLLITGPRGTCPPPRISAKPLAVAMVVLAAALPLWGGTSEIERYFAQAGGAAFLNAAQAMQMAYSLWWSAYAVALLIIGFAMARASLRYFAMIIFAVTVAKVFLVDMRQIEAIYRILSFMGLGSLLLAGSWFYNRYFRPKAKPARDE